MLSREPRRLLLVGMADYYDEGRRRGAEVDEICTNDGVVRRRPTFEERAGVVAELSRVSNPHAAEIARLFSVLSDECSAD